MKNDIAVGVQIDGTIDIGVLPDGEDWSTHTIDLEQAEFLHEELGRAIARQKERGFPKAEAPVVTKTEVST